jgi:hypothetical protein
MIKNIKGLGECPALKRLSGCAENQSEGGKMKSIIALIILSTIVSFGANITRAPETKAVSIKGEFEPSVTSQPPPPPIGLEQNVISVIPDMRAVAGSAGKNIAFAEDGQNVAVIYNRHSGDPENIMQPYVAYSTNRGNTWVHYGPFSTFDARRTYPGLDAEQNWPNPSDLRVHFAWHQAPSYSGSYDSSPAFYAKDVSYPDGLITSAFRLPNSGRRDVWMPCIAVKDSIVIYTANNNSTFQTDNNCYIWRSTDYGETWDTGRVFLPGPLDWMAGPHFRFGDNGYMFFLWNRQQVSNPNLYWPYYCESFDYGLTWTQPQLIWQNTPPYLDMSNVCGWWYQYDCEVVRDTPIATIKLGSGTYDYGEIWVYRPTSGVAGNWQFEGKKLVGGDSIAPQTFARFPTVAADDSGNIFIGYQAIFATGHDCGLFTRPAIQDTWYDWGLITNNGDNLLENHLEFAHNAPVITNGNSTIIGMIYHTAETYPTTGNLYFDYFVVPNPPIIWESVSVWLPDTVGAPNDTVVIPIMVSDLTNKGITSCDITLTFNRDILEVLPASLGSVVPPGWLIESNIFPDSTRIAMNGTTPLTDSGSLALIPFVVNNYAMPNETTTIYFTRCSFNGGSVLTRTQDGKFTVQGIYSISGYVKYYWTPYRAVPNTEMFLTGPKVDMTLTDTNGYYILNNIPGLFDYTVTPRKINSVKSPNVTSYDAALVLRHVVGIITLDSLRFIAGDVTGNGILSSYDAALILQYAVCIRNHFPAGARPGQDTVDWAFRPPSRYYPSLNANQLNQNYKAILYGDPSGNWIPSFDLIPDGISKDNIDKYMTYGGNLPVVEEKIATNTHEFTRIGEEVAEGFSLRNVTHQATERSSTEKNRNLKVAATSFKTECTVFPIKVSNAKDVISADIVLSYDPNEITIKDVSLGSSTADYLIAWSSGSGIVRVALAGERPLHDDVELAKVSYEEKRIMRMTSNTTNISPFQIRSIMLNEGQELININTSDGVAGNKIALPTQFALMANQPNPFKSQTAIRYSLPAESKISLQIYAVVGALVKTLVNGTRNPGFYTIQWDGTDNEQKHVASGVYFYELKTNNITARKKMIKIEN